MNTFSEIWTWSKVDRHTRGVKSMHISVALHVGTNVVPTWALTPWLTEMSRVPLVDVDI